MGKVKRSRPSFSQSVGRLGVRSGRSLVIGIVVVLVVVAVFVLPAIRVKPVSARSVKCAAQLHAIGLAIAEYQSRHMGANPPELEALVRDGYVGARMLVCPSSRDEEGECSYVYRGADLGVESPEGMILAYDKGENHPVVEDRFEGLFINVLYNDGSVRRCKESDLLVLIEQDNALRGELGLEEKKVEPRAYRRAEERPWWKKLRL